MRIIPIRILLLPASLFVYAAGLAAIAAQAPTSEPRPISTSPTVPIIKAIRPDEPHVLLRRVVFAEPVDTGSTPFPAVLVQYNPVIFTGRVIQKRPAFMDILRGGAPYFIVPMAQANWIGSYVTMQVERVVRNPDTFPLREGGPVTFVVDSDGSAMIGGTRVDTESYDQWPVEEGKRYFVTGILREDRSSKEQRFHPSGLWLEPFDGAPLRGPSRRDTGPRKGSPPVYETVPTFERDDLQLPLDIHSVADRLAAEVAKQKSKTP